MRVGASHPNLPTRSVSRVAQVTQQRTGLVSGVEATVTDEDLREFLDEQHEIVVRVRDIYEMLTRAGLGEWQSDYAGDDAGKYRDALVAIRHMAVRGDSYAKIAQYASLMLDGEGGDHDPR